MKYALGVVCLAGVWILAAAAQESPATVCRHAGGTSIPFDVASLEQAQADLDRRIRSSWGPLRSVALDRDRPFDGGLPACTRRSERRVSMDVPASLVGKQMLWSDVAGTADVVFRTKASSLKDLIQSGSLPGDAVLARQWGVRCVPSRVTVESPATIRIEEGR